MKKQNTTTGNRHYDYRNADQLALQVLLGKEGFLTEDNFDFTDIQTLDEKVLANGDLARVVTNNEDESTGFGCEVYIMTGKNRLVSYSVKFSFGTPAVVIANFLKTL